MDRSLGAGVSGNTQIIMTQGTTDQSSSERTEGFLCQYHISPSLGNLKNGRYVAL
jgi:hypothetical protein